MDNVLTYHDVVIKERAFTVAEERGRYVKLLDQAADQYLKGLQDIERRCSEKGADADKLFHDVVILTDAMLQVCAKFEEAVADTAAVKAARMEFHEKTAPMLSKSYFINRARTWPRGHQGDYMMLEMAYRNIPLSQGIGYYLDKYLLSTELAYGVRERIDMLADLLKKELSKRQAPTVLDVACGSCREILEIGPEITQSGARFTCVDLDTEALDFGLNRASYAGIPMGQMEFHQYNALRLFDYETALAEFGKRDIIYSVGYYDYLPDDFLVKLLRTLYQLLNPGGALIAAFKDVEHYQPQIYHWITDWDGFLQRSVNDFERLFREAGIPESALSLSRVKSGTIVFYTITKQTP